MSQRWWASDSSALQPVGFFGNVGRNTMIGPGAATVDWSVFKDFPPGSREGTQLQFRFESFNLLNRVNWGSPGSNVFQTAAGTPNPAFGRFTAARESRELQFGLKLTW